MNASAFAQAAKLISGADGLLITAGAGMGVDSGLPDFRGQDGFWKAYPALAQSGISFKSIANPAAFLENPYQAWGFYGHRLSLYRHTEPHKGFKILQELANKMAAGAFVITSNVDGQFQKAGFDESRIFEIHGSIHHLQCDEPCESRLWSADMIDPVTDDEQCKWLGKLPTCPRCGGVARPAVLMFNDLKWVESRAVLQEQAWEAWMSSVERLVVIELGAGVDLPSIRSISENIGSPLIRINPTHAAIPNDAGVSLSMRALRALEGIAAAMTRST